MASLLSVLADAMDENPWTINSEAKFIEDFLHSVRPRPDGTRLPLGLVARSSERCSGASASSRAATQPTGAAASSSHFDGADA